MCKDIGSEEIESNEVSVQQSNQQSFSSTNSQQQGLSSPQSFGSGAGFASAPPAPSQAYVAADASNYRTVFADSFARKSSYEISQATQAPPTNVDPSGSQQGANTSP